MVLSFLSRERTVAAPGYNRWLIPPAALCVHLCIGQVYAFSVFNLPLTRLIGITQSDSEDWKLTELGWTSAWLSFSRSLGRCQALCRQLRRNPNRWWTAPGNVHRRAVLGGWLSRLGARRFSPPTTVVCSVPSCSAAAESVPVRATAKKYRRLSQL
jgi:hypothetical protein